MRFRPIWCLHSAFGKDEEEHVLSFGGKRRFEVNPDKGEIQTKLSRFLVASDYCKAGEKLKLLPKMWHQAGQMPYAYVYMDK